MVEALLKEVVSAGRTEIILAAGEHLAGKIKAGYDIKKALKDVFTGESAAKTVVLMRSIITAARMVTATFLNDFIGNTLYFLI